MRPTRVLVPVDADVAADQGIAEHLVDDAVELAKAVGARVTLAHVVTAEAPTAAIAGDFAMAEAFRAMEGRLEARAEAAERRLHELEERARRAGADVDSVLIQGVGRVPETLVKKAREMAADLIVMATHGRKGLSRLVLGSIAERTAHIAGMPVLLLPAH